MMSQSEAIKGGVIDYQVLETVFGLRDVSAVEGVGLDDVRAGIEVFLF